MLKNKHLETFFIKKTVHPLSGINISTESVHQELHVSMAEPVS